MPITYELEINGQLFDVEFETEPTEEQIQAAATDLSGQLIDPPDAVSTRLPDTEPQEPEGPLPGPITEKTAKVPHEEVPKADAEPFQPEIGFNEQESVELEQPLAGPGEAPQAESVTTPKIEPIKFGTEYDPIINQVSGDFSNLEPIEIWAMGEIESGNGRALKNKKTSATGVRGPMQVTGATGDSLIEGFNASDPVHSYAAGAALLSQLKEKYNGDMEKVAAAYNGGEAITDQAISIAEKKNSDWKKEIHNTSAGKRMNSDMATKYPDTYGEKFRKTDEIVGHGRKYLAKLSEGDKRYKNKGVQTVKTSFGTVVQQDELSGDDSRKGSIIGAFDKGYAELSSSLTNWYAGLLSGQHKINKRRVSKIEKQIEEIKDDQSISGEDKLNSLNSLYRDLEHFKKGVKDAKKSAEFHSEMAENLKTETSSIFFDLSNSKTEEQVAESNEYISTGNWKEKFLEDPLLFFDHALTATAGQAANLNAVALPVAGIPALIGAQAGRYMEALKDHSDKAGVEIDPEAASVGAMLFGAPTGIIGGVIDKVFQLPGGAIAKKMGQKGLKKAATAMGGLAFGTGLEVLEELNESRLETYVHGWVIGKNIQKLHKENPEHPDLPKMQKYLIDTLKERRLFDWNDEDKRTTMLTLLTAGLMTSPKAIINTAAGAKEALQAKLGGKKEAELEVAEEEGVPTIRRDQAIGKARNTLAEFDEEQVGLETTDDITVGKNDAVPTGYIPKKDENDKQVTQKDGDEIKNVYEIDPEFLKEKDPRAYRKKLLTEQRDIYSYLIQNNVDIRTPDFDNLSKIELDKINRAREITSELEEKEFQEITKEEVEKTKEQDEYDAKVTENKENFMSMNMAEIESNIYSLELDEKDQTITDERQLKLDSLRERRDDLIREKKTPPVAETQEEASVETLLAEKQEALKEAQKLGEDTTILDIEIEALNEEIEEKKNNPDIELDARISELEESQSPADKILLNALKKKKKKLVSERKKQKPVQEEKTESRTEEPTVDEAPVEEAPVESEEKVDKPDVPKKDKPAAKPKTEKKSKEKVTFTAAEQKIIDQAKDYKTPQEEEKVIKSLMSLIKERKVFLKKHKVPAKADDKLKNFEILLDQARKKQSSESDKIKNIPYSQRKISFVEQKTLDEAKEIETTELEELEKKYELNSESTAAKQKIKEIKDLRFELEYDEKKTVKRLSVAEDELNSAEKKIAKNEQELLAIKDERQKIETEYAKKAKGKKPAERSALNKEKNLKLKKFDSKEKKIEAKTKKIIEQMRPYKKLVDTFNALTQKKSYKVDARGNVLQLKAPSGISQELFNQTVLFGEQMVLRETKKHYKEKGLSEIQARQKAQDKLDTFRKKDGMDFEKLAEAVEIINTGRKEAFDKWARDRSLKDPNTKSEMGNKVIKVRNRIVVLRRALKSGRVKKAQVERTLEGLYENLRLLRFEVGKQRMDFKKKASKAFIERALDKFAGIRKRQGKNYDAGELIETYDISEQMAEFDHQNATIRDAINKILDEIENVGRVTLHETGKVGEAFNKKKKAIQSIVNSEGFPKDLKERIKGNIQAINKLNQKKRKAPDIQPFIKMSYQEKVDHLTKLVPRIISDEGVAAHAKVMKALDRFEKMKDLEVESDMKEIHELGLRNDQTDIKTGYLELVNTGIENLADIEITERQLQISNDMESFLNKTQLDSKAAQEIRQIDEDFEKQSGNIRVPEFRGDDKTVRYQESAPRSLDVDKLYLLQTKLEILEKQIVENESLHQTADDPKGIKSDLLQFEMNKQNELFKEPPLITMVLKAEKALKDGRFNGDPEKHQMATDFVENLEEIIKSDPDFDQDMYDKAKKSFYYNQQRNPKKNTAKAIQKDIDELTIQGTKDTTVEQKKATREAIEEKRMQLKKIDLGFFPYDDIPLETLQKMERLQSKVISLENKLKEEINGKERGKLRAKISVTRANLGKLIKDTDDRFAEEKRKQSDEANFFFQEYLNEAAQESSWLKGQKGSLNVGTNLNGSFLNGNLARAVYQKSVEFFNRKRGNRNETERKVGENYHSLLGQKRVNDTISQKYIFELVQQLDADERGAMIFFVEGERHLPVTRKFNKPELQKALDKMYDPRYKEKYEKIKARIKNHNDQLWKIISKGMKDMDSRQIREYVTHMWGAHTMGEITEVNVENMVKFMTDSASLESRNITSYSEGIKAGMVPRYLDIAKIMDVNTQAGLQVGLNNSIIRMMKGANVSKQVFLAPDTKATQDLGWVPTRNLGLKVKEFDGMAVDPDMVPILNTLFTDKHRGPLTSFFEALNGMIKKFTLSYSMFHHYVLGESGIATQGIRKTLGSVGRGFINPEMMKENVLKAVYHGDIISAIRKGSYHTLTQKYDTVQDFVLHGGQVGSISDVQVERLDALLAKGQKIPVVGDAVFGSIRKVNKAWDRVLWDWFHNTLKIDGYEKRVKSRLENTVGLTEKQITVIKREAAQTINDTFGGQNWQALMTNPRFLQAQQALLLSPDWTISTAKQALAPFGLYSATKTWFGRKERAKLGLKFWTAAALKYGIGLNILNMYFRASDEDDRWKEKLEKLKNGERNLREELDKAKMTYAANKKKKYLKNLIEKYEQDLKDNRSAHSALMKKRPSEKLLTLDGLLGLTMYGNSEGNRFRLFTGSYLDKEGVRRERYFAPAKQYFDGLELLFLFDEPGGVKFAPLQAFSEKMSGKLNSLINMASFYVTQKNISQHVRGVTRNEDWKYNKDLREASRKGNAAYNKELLLQTATGMIPFVVSSANRVLTSGDELSYKDLLAVALPRKKGGNKWVIEDSVDEVLHIVMREGYSSKNKKELSNRLEAAKKRAERNGINFNDVYNRSFKSIERSIEFKKKKIKNEYNELLKDKEKNADRIEEILEMDKMESDFQYALENARYKLSEILVNMKKE